MSDQPQVRKARSFRRVLLKLSGEILRGARDSGFDGEAFDRIAEEIKAALHRHVELALVVGGGNIFRGASGKSVGIDRTAGDQIGMLATVANGLALRSVLLRHGVPAQVMSAIPIPGVVAQFDCHQAIALLEAGTVMIFVAGTGNPFFTTDTAAALRGLQIGADAMLKGTKVDGVFSADPVTHPEAELFTELTYQEVLARELSIMDLSATGLCASQKLPVIVFNMKTPGTLSRILDGEPVGTVIDA